jgi:uncharacterized protein
VKRPRRKWLTRALTRPPFHDELGAKGWFTRISRAPPHVVRRLALNIPGWPRLARPLRIAYLSDFHAGSHADDVARLGVIVAQAATFRPDLVLHGGDFVNMQTLGGGRIPPRIVAQILARLDAPLGRFAVLGNHDYTYGAEEVAGALTSHGIRVLSDAGERLKFEGHAIDLVGLPDKGDRRPQGRSLLAGLAPDQPAIVLAHDPAWFARVPSGPYLALAGHTHGGQVRLPLLGVLLNFSRAPLRWSYGHIVEDGRNLYVTSGLGTSGVPLRIGVPPEFVVIDVSGPEVADRKRPP